MAQETGNEQVPAKLKVFTFEGKQQPVEFVETTPEEQLAEGVECDVYKFTGDETKDLGIIRIKPGKKTPLQKVLKGDRTIEGFVSGKGKLLLARKGGEIMECLVDEEEKIPLAVEVQIGDLMQWEAAPDSNLVAYEICFPPYAPGRFENLS